MGAYQLRDHAAAINVPDQHDRHVRSTGKAHVGDIAGTEVHLCGAASTFDDDQVMGG